MFSADQLRWIKQNRRPRWGILRLGASAARVLEVVESRGPYGLAEAVAQAIAAVVDGDFVSHCRVGELRRGQLTIYVDDARLTFAYRTQWSQRLGQQIRAVCPGSGLRSVRFVEAERSHSPRRSSPVYIEEGNMTGPDSKGRPTW